MVKKKENEKFCKEHYGIVDKKTEEIRRKCCLWGKTTLSWRWLWLSEMGLFDRQLEMQGKREALVETELTTMRYNLSHD